MVSNTNRNNDSKEHNDNDNNKNKYSNDHNPKAVMEKDNISILWDVLISTGWAILADHQDIVIENKRVGVYPFQCSQTVWQQHLLEKLSKYKDLEIDPGGYSEFQVMGMIEGFLWVWNFRFRDFLGRKIWEVFFWVTWFKSGFFGYSKQSEDSW